ncbi:hypothetical protein ABE522_03090 [Stenotrophomonas pennii]|uniref:hypothetical protein n=1 Tax=Stenotrophomonas lacuserhaii TaxID=2760084 RepID=UPI0032090E03
MDRNSRGAGGHGHDALHRVRQEGRWWWLQARHTRRIWRWALLAAGVLFLALILLRKPLADWFWDEPRIQQLLEQGDHALASGRLSAADGTGAREYFQAALALDNDRSQAREGLARTGMAALQSGELALAGDDLDSAAEALALARQLQVPQRASDALARQLRARRAAGAGLDVLLGQARQALAAGRLDDTPDDALPLLQRVLELRPLDVAALEMREDALSDLLLRARAASEDGEVLQAARLVQRARAYDPGHADLPASQEALSRALESRARRAANHLRRGRLDAAMEQLQPAQDAAGDEPSVATQRERLAAALLKDALRLAADYRFDEAVSRLDDAQRWQVAPRDLAAARQQVERVRAGRQPQRGSGARSGAGRQQLERLLERLGEAEARGQLIAPPGASAYDALREAQSLAPDDRRVAAAAKRLLPASRHCFEDALRENRVQAAGACLDAWQTLAPTDSGIGRARNRLALRWVAVGSERLGSGDVAFAARAAAQARLWQPALAELPAFEARVRQAGGLPP